MLSPFYFLFFIFIYNFFEFKDRNYNNNYKVYKVNTLGENQRGKRQHLQC